MNYNNLIDHYYHLENSYDSVSYVVLVPAQTSRGNLRRAAQLLFFLPQERILSANAPPLPTTIILSVLVNPNKKPRGTEL